MTETLKPCPFCGGAKIGTGHIRDGRVCGCATCGASVRAYHGPDRDTEGKVRAIWNGRTADDRPAGERQDVITYRVENAAGARRIEGRPLEEAERIIAALETDPGETPLKLIRTTYVAFRHQEEIRTIEYKAPGE